MSKRRPWIPSSSTSMDRNPSWSGEERNTMTLSYLHIFECDVADHD